MHSFEAFPVKVGGDSAGYRKRVSMALARPSYAISNLFRKGSFEAKPMCGSEIDFDRERKYEENSSP